MRAKPRDSRRAGKLRKERQGRSHTAKSDVTRLRAHGALLQKRSAGVGRRLLAALPRERGGADVNA